ncbi:hypothetical protein WME73_38230 [Sorangium sp. So ce302]|uniref:hypothetical protein n=1 Tax=Sorangium sp. So ce302 TaxID=3133297 RepID=UPI003F6004CD
MAPSSPALSRDAVERGGIVRARYRGEVVEIPCEVVDRASDGRTLVCVADRVAAFEADEVVG